jgi:hypothetical protein
MSAVANRRAFLEAANTLVRKSAVEPGDIISVCQTLGAVLSDLTGTPVVVIPQGYKERKPCLTCDGQPPYCNDAVCKERK